MKKSKRNTNRNKKQFNSGKQIHRRRQKTNWQFEQLESRLAFSVATLDYTPITLGYTPVVLETVSLSNDTPAGADAIWQRELEWAARMAAVSTAGESEYFARSALPNDPMFPYQWHLLNTGDPNTPVGDPLFPQPLLGTAGEDINVVPVWNLGYTGEGVIVAVLDSGVQTLHPDLVENLSQTLRFNAINGTSNPNPNVVDPGAFHGTAVAGLIAAVWNNLGEQAVNRIQVPGGQIREEPVFDRDGNPVYVGGGTGVAPNATIVPILMLGAGAGPNTAADAFEYAWMEIDITNNSWGPADNRTIAAPLTPEELTIIRETIRNGRNGLGTVHVWASGNGGGPSLSGAFSTFGNYDSSSYDPWVNSRYTIGITGVDHDGLYANFDGTFTAYPEAGPSVLVAAPTGSNVAQDVATDLGQGSGIWTADFLDDFGANAHLDPDTLLDPDLDFWPDADYTARFNGTSASAPIASGVIALMLEANPNLTYRDVQEILVRSARQNAQFEIPSSGGISGVDLGLNNTWQTNQLGLFRNPDPWSPLEDPVQAQYDPLADPNFPIGGLASRPLTHYESQPPLFTNGAGYTVSQGYGVYGEQIGYAHGVIDAELAVKMALQWHTLGQDIAPNTEKTFTTFVLQPGLNIPAADTVDPTGMIVPGGLGGVDGFIDYWDEYFEDDPFVGYTGPFEDARGSFLTFHVPDNQAINLEWVEVKVEISGSGADLDFLRINLISPEGTHSDLNNYYYDLGTNTQPAIGTQIVNDPAGSLTGGTLAWTFSTNRIWGERTSDALIYDPVTGLPILETDPTLGPQEAFKRGWELHIENWSGSEFTLVGLEIVWHGKPLAQNTQRVQGIIGIDENSDGDFNYTRYDQTVTATDPLSIRSTHVDREVHYEFDDTNNNGELDPGETQHREGFAANMLVEAFRVVNGVPENNAIARFLTGADGNYYFDLVPDEYVIRVTDPLDRVLLDDVDTVDGYLRHYLSEWHITEDWFYAQDRELVDFLNFNDPPEVLFDEVLGHPVQFLDGFGNPIQTGIKNLNFLIKDPEPLNQFIMNGNVFADINANGVFDGDDSPFGGVRVYWDENQNGVFDAGEIDTLTSDDPLSLGTYTLTIPAFAPGTFTIGVVPPSSDWLHTVPATGVLSVYARPGDIIGDITNTDILDGDVNFFLDPPNDAFPPGGDNLPGNILGVVYNDKDGDGLRDVGDDGIAGFRVYIDVNENGMFDGTDVEAITSSNGSFSFADVPVLDPQSLIRLEIEHDASWQLTAPSAGYLEVALGEGGTVTGQLFGLKNLADRDRGDLPNTFGTLGAGGASHLIVPGYYLGTKIDGEVDGLPGANADGDDAIGNDEDGVFLISNGGVLQPGINTVEVTVAGLGGILNAWIDLNGNGVFDLDPNLGEQVFTNVDLNPGVYELTFDVDTIVAGNLGARFRWGEFGLGFSGPATIGEVEDYLWSATNVQPVVLPGDYNSDVAVNIADYVLWRDRLGSSAPLDNDEIGGIVSTPHYDQWVANFGEPSSGGGSGSAAVSASEGGSSSGESQQDSGSSSRGVQSLIPTLASYGGSGITIGSSFASSSDSSGSSSGTTSTNSGYFSRRNELLDLALATLADDADEADSDRETFEDEEEEFSELALSVALEEVEW